MHQVQENYIAAKELYEATVKKINAESNAHYAATYQEEFEAAEKNDDDATLDRLLPLMKRDDDAIDEKYGSKQLKANLDKAEKALIEWGQPQILRGVRKFGTKQDLEDVKDMFKHVQETRDHHKELMDLLLRHP